MQNAADTVHIADDYDAMRKPSVPQTRDGKVILELYCSWT
jgi:hypothetical protein